MARRKRYGVEQIIRKLRGAEVRAPGPPAKQYYLVLDHRGSVCKVIRKKKNEVVATRLYNAFGEIVSEAGTRPDEVPFAYQSNWLFLCDLPDGSPLYLSPTRVYHAGVGMALEDGGYCPRDRGYMAAYAITEPSCILTSALG